MPAASTYSGVYMWETPSGLAASMSTFVSASAAEPIEGPVAALRAPVIRHCDGERP